MGPVHRFTSEDLAKLFHFPALGVKHFPFNVDGIEKPSPQKIKSVITT
jgi:hypothetical protein